MVFPDLHANVQEAGALPDGDNTIFLSHSGHFGMGGRGALHPHPGSGSGRGAVCKCVLCPTPPALPADRHSTPSRLIVCSVFRGTQESPAEHKNILRNTRIRMRRTQMRPIPSPAARGPRAQPRAARTGSRPCSPENLSLSLSLSRASPRKPAREQTSGPTDPRGEAWPAPQAAARGFEHQRAERPARHQALLESPRAAAALRRDPRDRSS